LEEERLGLFNPARLALTFSYIVSISQIPPGIFG
jgi:hypothetical protein